MIINPAQTSLLMSATNPEGPTLEMVCEQSIADLREKTRFAREMRDHEYDEVKHNAWSVCIRNNVEIIQNLERILALQTITMKTFDSVFPQETPRVVSK